MRPARVLGAVLAAGALLLSALVGSWAALPPSRGGGVPSTGPPVAGAVAARPPSSGVARPRCPGSAATYSYGPDQWQRFDVWRPVTDRYRSTAGTYPTVVIYHGGGWVLGDRCHGMPYYARLLASEGYLAISVDYRRLGSRDGRGHLVGLVDTSNDAVKALSRIMARAAFLRADRARLATVGTSAGGHLAHLAANRAGGVRATVSWSGFPAVQGLVERWNSTTIHGEEYPQLPIKADEMAARARPPRSASASWHYQQIDPVRSVQHSPPHQLLLSSAWDRFILPGMPFEYARAAHAAGRDARVIVFSDRRHRGLHAGAMWANSRFWDRATTVDAYVQRWLRGALGLARPVAAPKLRFETVVSFTAGTGVSVRVRDFRISALPGIDEGVYGATAWVQRYQAGRWARVSPMRHVRMMPNGRAAVAWAGLRGSPRDKLRVVVTTPAPVIGAAVQVPAVVTAVVRLP